MSETRIEAAGGVVVRGKGADQTILVIHRPKYDDWSLPKGKLDPGEAAKEAALREVAEETGHQCRIIGKLQPVFYEKKGAPKRVRYWLMKVEGGEFEPNEEVDAIEWWSPADAARSLSHQHDRELIAATFD